MGNKSSEVCLNEYSSVVGGYAISDTASGATSYNGYVNKDGEWYIQRGITAAGVTNYTYSKGSASYPWAQRAAQVYAAFNAVFG